MTNPEDISNIAKEMLRTGIVTNTQVSELARLTAKQIYLQGYQAGEMADKTDVWNNAIETCINELDKIGHSTEADIERIRKLQK